MRGLVTSALTERDGYLDDLKAVTQDLSKDFGLTWDPKVELTAVKGMDKNGNWTEGGLGRIVEKLQEGRKVTDALRSTIMLPQDAAPRSAEYIEGVRAAMMARDYDVYLKNGKEDIDDRFLNPTTEGYRDIAFKFTKNGVVRELQLIQEHMRQVKNGRGHEILEELQGRLGKQLDPKDRIRLQEEAKELNGYAVRLDNPSLFGGTLPASTQDAMPNAQPSRASSEEYGMGPGNPSTSALSPTSSSNVYPPHPLARSSSTVGNVRSDISITSNKSIPQSAEGTPPSIQSEDTPFSTAAPDTREFKRWFGDWEAAKQNQTVNEQIRQWAEGKLPTSDIIDMGKPSDVLKRYGIPDFPITLVQSVLNKAVNKKHGVTVDDLKDIAAKIQSPIAVFKDTRKIDPEGMSSRIIITDIRHKNGNILAAIRINVERDGIEINDIRSVYPKKDENINKWIQEGLLLGLEKNKGRQWLENSAPSNSGQPQVTTTLDNLIIHENPDFVNTSKVVDENGAPLKVYHGTAAEFHTFEEGYGKSFKRRGIFFTDNDNVSEAFSASDKAIKKAYLNIRNPLIIDANGKHWTELEFEGKKIDSDDLAGIARERGYDGVIIRDVADPYPLRGNTYIALSPTQIKYSDEVTYDDSGKPIPQEQRFDPQNPDSRYATGSGRAANRTLAGDEAEGRPDLANPGLNDEARRGMRVSDEYTYKDQERKRDEDTIAEAATLDRNKVRQKIMAGQGLSDAETLAGQEIITEAYGEAMRSGNLGAMRRAVKLAHGWRVGGRELARSMRMRRDQMQTPAQRFEQALGAAFILPNKNVTSIQEQLGKDNISDQTRSELEQELEKELKKLALENARLRLKLARRGLVIDKLKRDLENAKTEREKQQAEDDAKSLIGDILASRKGVGDALYEYWISSLLSGPQTQVVNITSNVVHTVWELGPQRIIEAFVNSFASKAEAAQWGEFKYMGAALKPGLSRALRNMVRSWKTERPTFQEELDRSQVEGSTIGLTTEYRGGAMDKYVGKRMARAIRIPLRGLMALDEFTKSMAGQMDAAAHAYRIGKGRGLRGDELEDFIQEQVDDLSSAAWEAGLNTALRVTFQTPLSPGAERASQWLGNTPGKWIIPFRRTPLNIFKTGIRKLPFGTWSTVKHWKTMDNDTKVRMLSEQVIAWSLAAAIAGLVLGGDDDDEPWITGSIPYKPSARGETLLKERTIPAQSIRIGGKYYSYARIEPFATTLQGIVDAAVAVKEIQSGRPAVDAGLDLMSKSLEAVTDKTFLRGMGDIYDALKQPESKGVSWVTNFATSWAPNIVKQVARATDSVYREQSLGKGGDYFDRLRDRIEYRVIPKADMLPPKRTPWGEEIRKIEGASPATDFFYRLLSPIANTTPAGRDPRAVKLDRLLTNWNNAHWDDTWAPEPPDRYITHNNTRYDLSDAEYDQLIKQCGEIALEHLEAYSLNSDFLTSSGLFNNYSESGSALF